MAVFRTVIRSDLQKPLVVQQLSGNMFTADNASNEIAVEVTNGGEPVALSGAVTAYAVRADGVTAMFSGTINGNVASVILPASCYVEVGTLSIVIKVGTTTVGACTCYVYRTTTDEIVDPGHVIPSIDELLEQIEACRTATANANTAATNANTAASNANTKAALADEKATLADQKATLANTAAQNADTKAGLANDAATLANTKAGLANDAAALANTKAALADEKATLADAKATLADTAATNANTKAGLADTAAQNADEKATLANNAATLANTKAGLADTAATNANTAAGKIDNMTVAATGLPEGSAPIATISEVDGHKHIMFQIPKGDKGKDFRIAKTFASISAMMAYTGTDLEKYDFAMIDTGSVEDPDTGKLYCYEPEKNPKWSYIGDLSGAQGIKGETGTGIDHVTLNNDYTLTIYYDDGTQFTTTSIRGATGITPAITIGTVATLQPGQQAYVTRDPSSTNENPVFNFGIPKGDTGSAENVYGTTVPMSESDSTSVYNAIVSKLDKNQGTSNVGKFMKVGANGELTPENVPDPTNKADKVTNATAGNFAGLDATGNLTDSGKSAEDFAGAIYKTATPGSIITIEDGADDLPIKELKVAVDPVQDLHGYDHPWPAGGGKNVLTVPDADFTLNGVRYVSTDGIITLNGTSTGEINAKNAAFKNNWSFTIPAGTYYFYRNTFETPTYLVTTIDGEDTYLAINSGTFTLTEPTTVWIGFYVYSRIYSNVNPPLQLEAGTTPTSYVPVSNICPITGWTGAKVSRTGNAQQWDEEYESGAISVTDGSLISNENYMRSKNFIPVAQGKRFYRAGTYMSDGRAFFYDKNRTFISHLGISSRGTFDIPSGACFMLFHKKNATYNHDISINYPATDTEYHPYQGKTYDITFPSEAGTVYGGTLNPGTGELVVDRASVSFPNNHSFKLFTNQNKRRFEFDTSEYGLMKNELNSKSSHFKLGRLDYASFGYFYLAKTTSTTYFTFYDGDSKFASASEFETWLQDQATNGTPVQVTFELATPVTYQLTAPQVRTLLGLNHIWADTGNITELIYPVNTDTAMALYEKADKVANATAGNFAALDAEGNLTDSGKKPSDFLTEHQDISGKLDKDQGSTNSGKFMKVGFDGKLVPDTIPDPTGKADKVSGATNGNFAGLDANGNLTDSGKNPSDILTQANVVDLIYPVGSIYMSVASTSPATLFDGTTWEQLKDRFLLGAGDTYTAGDTGGNASHTLTTSEMPSHNHSFTGSAVNTGNQSAGHTHKYTDYYATTTGNTAITVAQMPSHNHGKKSLTGYVQDHAAGVAGMHYSVGGIMSGTNRNDTKYINPTDIGMQGGAYSYGGFNVDASHTHDSNGSGNNHNHSGANTSTTRTSEGISANHTHSVTASGTIGNEGGGNPFSIMPPYLAVYMWKRTA